MPAKQPANHEPSRQPWIRSRDQGSVFALVASGFLLTVCYWFYHGGHRGGLVEIDRADPLEADFLVDVNRATWPEIIQLPGLGEVLAQRVITEREQNGPFRDVDDLVRVDGIGVKTLEKIRPYLLPIPKDTDWADVEVSRDETLQ